MNSKPLFPNRFILIVEDSFTQAEYLKSVFTKQGWQVETAFKSNGGFDYPTNQLIDTLAKVKALVDRKTYSFVLLDLDLPDEKGAFNMQVGLDILSWLRQTQPACMVVITSSFADKKETREASNRNAENIYFRGDEDKTLYENPELFYEEIIEHLGKFQREVIEVYWLRRFPGPIASLWQRYQEESSAERAHRVQEIYRHCLIHLISLLGSEQLEKKQPLPAIILQTIQSGLWHNDGQLQTCLDTLTRDPKTSLGGNIKWWWGSHRKTIDDWRKKERNPSAHYSHRSKSGYQNELWQKELLSILLDFDYITAPYHLIKIDKNQIVDNTGLSQYHGYSLRGQENSLFSFYSRKPFLNKVYALHTIDSSIADEEVIDGFPLSPFVEAFFGHETQRWFLGYVDQVREKEAIFYCTNTNKKEKTLEIKLASFAHN